LYESNARLANEIIITLSGKDELGNEIIYREKWPKTPLPTERNVHIRELVAENLDVPEKWLG
jgi:hypothetical protein